MFRYKIILLAVVAAVVIAPSRLFAQGTYGTLNTYTPYTMYGIGELQTQGTLSTRSMAGMGLAVRTPSEINVLNPASFSSVLGKSILFNYGMEGSNNFNTQNLSGSNVSSSYATFNFHDIAIQIPLAKRLGLGLSLAPYSNVGYAISSGEIYSDIGYLSTAFEGSGDITKVQLGVGWEPYKNLSIGLSLHYYWGNILRMYSLEPYNITGSGIYYSAVGEANYQISSLKAQVGVQWSPIATATKNLTFGATYDLGGDLNPIYTDAVYGYVSSGLITIISSAEADYCSLVIPSQIAAGVAYRTPKMLVGLDYTYQDWHSKNGSNVEYTSSGVEVAYNDFSTCKLGFEYVPRRNDVRKYLNRVIYRAGMRYGGYQQTFDGESLTQYAATIGLGFPIRSNGITRIDVGAEYGHCGNGNVIATSSDASVALIKQNYVKLSLGFSLFGEDYWFQRPKFD